MRRTGLDEFPENLRPRQIPMNSHCLSRSLNLFFEERERGYLVARSSRWAARDSARGNSYPLAERRSVLLGRARARLARRPFRGCVPQRYTGTRAAVQLIAAGRRARSPRREPSRHDRIVDYKLCIADSPRFFSLPFSPLSSLAVSLWRKRGRREEPRFLDGRSFGNHKTLGVLTSRGGPPSAPRRAAAAAAAAATGLLLIIYAANVARGGCIGCDAER